MLCAVVSFFIIIIIIIYYYSSKLKCGGEVSAMMTVTHDHFSV